MPVAECVRENEITGSDYELIRSLIYKRVGINLGDNRQQLVQARLAKIIRMGKFRDFEDYFQFLKSEDSEGEIANLIDAISTNTTYFFRESKHFDFLRESISSRIETDWKNQNHCLRIWSAACSSGEEPYTIAMIVHKLLQNHPNMSVKILATDISQEILAKAKEGLYSMDKLKNVPPEFAHTYFKKVTKGETQMVQVDNTLKNMITFSSFNLISPEYPFRHGFDYVFCRNVMIYFDSVTQEHVVNHIAKHLKPGGYLLVGHSESLSALNHKLKYVQPALYKRN